MAAGRGYAGTGYGGGLPAGFDPGSGGRPALGAEPRATRRSPAATASGGGGGGGGGPGSGTQYSDGLTGLMAVNLIRAHREELIQASTGKLDHMVIDVVGSLFDQILSDSRVPPQMARADRAPAVAGAARRPQRLDASSRRGATRCAASSTASPRSPAPSTTSTTARARIPDARARAGARDRRRRLRPDRALRRQARRARELHRRADRRARSSSSRRRGRHARRKESELRLQQRYMLQLQSALGPLPLPTYLREFLAAGLEPGAGAGGAARRRRLRSRRGATGGSAPTW